ncbi:pleiotropic regulatory protein RsmS [Gayadomonas joobiniege]|uniref:pleiotropic regulatory protein RsmS n=1 Tax=Gayadomonas joobiniege TaxID=1234606 RepID=UPI000372575E|nr:pleiotropic regulatory protein RsmS [Gayadomonas joobiniege]
MSLENAPNHVKLAVDLIYLLESNEVAPADVLKALKIVEQDFSNKQAELHSPTANIKREV